MNGENIPEYVTKGKLLMWCLATYQEVLKVGWAGVALTSKKGIFFLEFLITIFNA